MINQTHLLRKKVCQFLQIGYHAIAVIEEWANCLFVKIKKGFGKLINRFVSKKAISANLPTTDDHYYIKIFGRNHKVDVVIDHKSSTINVFCITNGKTKLGSFDVADNRIVRGFWGDEKLGRADLRFIDFEAVTYDIGFKEQGHYRHMRVLTH